jgi:hypothetical protein
MNNAAGAMDPARVVHHEPMVRNTIDMVNKHVKENSQKVKNAEAVLLRFVRK